jgi:hypothetical protein
MALTSQQRQEVLALLNQYACAYSEKNPGKIIALASQGISGFGSGPDEIVAGFSRFEEQVGRDLAQADAVSLSFDVLRLDGVMPFAWVTAFCTFDVRVKEQRLALKGRMTVLFHNTGSRWLIEQLHFSLPSGQQEPGQSYPAGR